MKLALDLSRAREHKGRPQAPAFCATAILTAGLMRWAVSSMKGKIPRFGAVVDDGSHERHGYFASGSRAHVAFGYLIGGLLMLGGSACELFIGVEAAGKSLEAVSTRLQSK